jgi:hypothetical protein
MVCQYFPVRPQGVARRVGDIRHHRPKKISANAANCGIPARGSLNRAYRPARGPVADAGSEEEAGNRNAG